MIITLSDGSYKECENLFRLPAALVFLTSCQKVVKKKSANDLINMMYVCMFTWRYLFIHFKIRETTFYSKLHWNPWCVNKRGLWISMISYRITNTIYANLNLYSEMLCNNVLLIRRPFKTCIPKEKLFIGKVQ